MNVISLFFSWPAGGTWSNMIASFEWAIVAFTCIWLFRDHIGRHLAKWWHKHHGPHAVEQHLEALRRHEENKHGA